MKPMYPGTPFSPSTTLAQGIGAADTTIVLADASVLPAAPNYATIGVDADGEVISYAAKAGNILSGCVRGVEGAAHAWNAGTEVGRNWNNIDYQNLIDNITEIAETRSEKPSVYESGNLLMLSDAGDPCDSGLPAATLIDATLSQSGRVAEAKAVGEALRLVLPSVSSKDAGKFLRVSEAGEWKAETIVHAEEEVF